MFCTLCACCSSDVHQPNKELCDRFCGDKEDGWFRYHHPILCSETVQADLLQEVERLKQLISADLEELNRNSKI